LLLQFYSLIPSISCFWIQTNVLNKQHNHCIFSFSRNLINLGHDYCYHYHVINERNRAAGVDRGNFLRCDQRDIRSPRWYRFTGAAGYEMPTACVPKHRCGAHAPGWLSTPHPTRTGQIINGKVCFHWSGNCCRWSTIIQVKKCSGFYIYKLGKTPCCYLRYCGNGGFGKCLKSFFNDVDRLQSSSFSPSSSFSMPCDA